MSIASDIRAYADNAVTEGRKVLDSTLSTAQAQLGGVTGQANDIVNRANSAVHDLRASAEKAVNVDAIKAALEPYVAQAKGYQASVTDRAEAIFAELRKDPRLARAFDVADSVSDAVVETMQERVVKPVQSLTGRGTTTAPAGSPRPAAKTTPRKTAARKAATTRPAAKKTTTRKAAAKRATSA
ncbi:hypothetical protein SAMN05443575_2008 [Jatrophihabitans endophyticus]|uniref:Uncharacterized protein n=1 Tax=Jatrophihabitans endophyticus TaxID=1206085 RepID=A0A1M5IV92_9ACTN|nr:hypothetical protein [Jatrophihabitans endophyticus]SHG31959.1 hypothetical protein SAMN05443575_2008 [Jatrophihabitans endophyticus]